MAARGFCSSAATKKARAQEPVPAWQAAVIFGIQEDQPERGAVFWQGAGQFEQDGHARSDVVCARHRCGPFAWIRVPVGGQAAVVVRGQDDLRRLVRPRRATTF